MKNKIIIVSSVAVISALIATAVFIAVQAVPSAFEAEGGSNTANAVNVTDTSASNGNAVKFQAPSGGGGNACAVAKRAISASDVSSRLNSGYPAGTEVFVPGGPDPWGGCFPGTANTGIPSGTSLSAYSGPCTISTSNTIIDSKTINCDLNITGTNIVIKNSKINAGNIDVSGSFALTDSEVNFGSDINTEGLKGSNITVTRANMYGGKRQIWCNNCTLQDSYLHDQLRDNSGVTHESAARIDQGSNYIHNTLYCNAPTVPPDAGCSANQTGYPDFAPVKNITLEKNFYMAGEVGYCSYGGATAGKPYSNDVTNATNIKSLNNVFQRGTSPNDRTTIALTDKRRYTCGFYGVTTAYNSAKVGFQFTGNMWDDGLLFVNDSTYPYNAFYD